MHLLSQPGNRPWGRAERPKARSHPHRDANKWLPKPEACGRGRRWSGSFRTVFTVPAVRHGHFRDIPPTENPIIRMTAAEFRASDPSQPIRQVGQCCQTPGERPKKSGNRRSPGICLSVRLEQAFPKPSDSDGIILREPATLLTDPGRENRCPLRSPILSAGVEHPSDHEPPHRKAVTPNTALTEPPHDARTNSPGGFGLSSAASVRKGVGSWGRGSGGVLDGPTLSDGPKNKDPGLRREDTSPLQAYEKSPVSPLA